jgi:hypothetical protein
MGTSPGWRQLEKTNNRDMQHRKVGVGAAGAPDRPRQRDTSSRPLGFEKGRGLHSRLRPHQKPAQPHPMATAESHEVRSGRRRVSAVCAPRRVSCELNRLKRKPVWWSEGRWGLCLASAPSTGVLNLC